jgi:hypothetical protein
MHKYYFSFTLMLSLSLALATPLSAANEGLSFKEQLEKANDCIKIYRHFEAGDALKEATKLGGAKHPSLHMRLGVLYYDLGLIPEAIAEGEKAVSLAPSSKWYKYDLAKFYYVDKQYSKAKEQFITLLKLDPGFTLGYYYLAELFFRNKDYDMAWLSFQRARLLGHRGKHLEEKLTSFTKKPAEDFSKISKSNMIVRFIKLSSEDEAMIILDKISKGMLFENLELELKKEKSGTADFGVMNINELQDSVADTLRNRQPYSPPVVMKTGSDYCIMQQIIPFDPVAWRTIVGATSASPKDSKEKPPVVATTSTKNDTEVTSLEPPSGSATPIAIKASTAETQQFPRGKEKEQLATQLAAYYALESWKNAWQAADIPRYFAAYSSTFTPPDNMDLATWKKKRTASLTRPKFIHLTIKDPVVELVTDSHLLITFTQTFQSDTYQDEVIKILTMVKEKGGWKISDERSAEVPYR